MTEKENLLHYLRHEPFDHVPTPLILNKSNGVVVSVRPPVCERPTVHSGYDVFGVHWTEAVRACHYTHGQKPIYEDIEDWRESVRIPKVEKFDWEAFRADCQAVDREQKILSVVMHSGPFERTTSLTSFEDCLVNMISDPEDFSDLIGAIADYKIALIGKIAEVGHPDVYLIHDDWGSSHGTLMSPALWRQVIKPHTQRIYDAIKAAGGIICQHSCGAIGPLVGDMVEMGADCWDGEEACNDYPALKAQYGDRLIFVNRISTTDAEAAVRKTSEKYPGYPQVPTFLYED